MDADDICLPDRLERQIEAFESDPALTLCGTRVDVLNSRARVTVLPETCVEPEELRILHIFHPVLIHPTAMFRRKHLVEGRLVYDETYRHAEDFDLFRRITREGRARVLAMKGVVVRRHGNQNVSSIHAEAQTISHFKIVSEQLRYFNIADGCEVLFPLASTEWRGGEAELQSVSNFFIELREFRGFRHGDRVAYLSGLTLLLWQVFHLLSERVGPRLAIRTARNVGLIEAFPLRYRLASALSPLPGGQIATSLASFGFGVLDELRATPLERIVDIAPSCPERQAPMQLGKN
jgi:hypothetical protein